VKYCIRDGCNVLSKGSMLLCDSCLLKKFGLKEKKYNHDYFGGGGFDYYYEEDVVKALRMASGL